MAVTRHAVADRGRLFDRQQGGGYWLLLVFRRRVVADIGLGI